MVANHVLCPFHCQAKNVFVRGFEIDRNHVNICKVTPVLACMLPLQCVLMMCRPWGGHGPIPFPLIDIWSAFSHGTQGGVSGRCPENGHCQ